MYQTSAQLSLLISSTRTSWETECFAGQQDVHEKWNGQHEVQEEIEAASPQLRWPVEIEISS